MGDLALVFAPGVEFESEDAADPEVVVSFSDDEGAHSNTHFAFRVGATYALRPAPRFSLVPQFNADFIAGEGPTLVYGLAVGFGF